MEGHFPVQMKFTHKKGITDPIIILIGFKKFIIKVDELFMFGAVLFKSGLTFQRTNLLHYDCMVSFVMKWFSWFSKEYYSSFAKHIQFSSNFKEYLVCIFLVGGLKCAIFFYRHHTVRTIERDLFSVGTYHAPAHSTITEYLFR